MKALMFASLLAAGLGTAHAANLYNNGPVVDASGLSVVPATDSAYGYSVYAGMNFAVADDFSVAAGTWSVTDIELFAYQPMADPRFFFHNVVWSLVSGDDPNTGSVIASGRTVVTNGGVVGYRVTADDPGSIVRSIYKLQADIPDVVLPAGHYWLTWSIAASENYDGPFSVPTADFRPGNAMTSAFGGSYQGIADPTSGFQYDLAFALNGSVTAVPEPGAAALWVLGLAGLGFARQRRS